MKKATHPYLLALLFFSFFQSKAQSPKLVIPSGHMFQVERAFFSEKDKYIVTYAENIKIWESATGKLLKNIDSKERPVDVDLYHNNEMLAASYPDSVRFWNIREDKIIRSVAGTNFNINEEDGVIIIMSFDDNDPSKTKNAKLYDLESFRLLHEFELPVASPGENGKYIAVDINKINIYDAAFHILYSNRSGNIIGISDDYGLLAIQQDTLIEIVNTSTNKILHRIPTDKISKHSIEFFPENNLLMLKVTPMESEKGFVSQNKNTYFMSMDLASYKLLNRFPEQRGNLLNWAFTDELVAATSTDSTIRVWNMKSGKLISVMKDSTGNSSRISFSGSHRFIVASSNSSSARIWDIDKKRLHKQLEENTSYIKTLRFAGDDKLALIQRDNDVWVWDIMKGSPILSKPGERNRITRDCSITTDSRKLFILTEEKTKTTMGEGTIFSFNLDDSQYFRLEEYDLRSGLHQKNIPIPEKLFRHGISPGGETLVAGFRDSTFLVFDIASGNVTWRSGKLSSTVDDISFTSDGNHFIIVADERFSIYDSRSYEKVFRSKETGPISSYAYNPVTGIAVMMLNNKRVVIRNTRTGVLITEVAEFEQRAKNIVFDNSAHRIVFDSSGKYACIKALADSAIIIIDTESGAIDKSVSLNSYSADFSFNNKNNLWIRLAGGKMIEWDIIRKKPVWSALYDAEYIKDIQRSGQYLLGSTHSEIKIIDTKSQSLKYSVLLLANSNYIVTDSLKRYDGTEAARKQLYFTCGTEFIELDQVKDQLWVPNLAERIMNGETINAQKLSDLNICNLTPVVDTIEQTGSQYRFQVTPRLGGLGATIVYVNGIEVIRYMPTQLVKQKDTYQLAIDKKELQKFFVFGKENSIVVRSLTAKSSISSRSVSINEKGKEKSNALPNLYAVVVGISDYKGEGLDLKFAAKDAEDIGNVLNASAKKLLNTDGKDHVFIYRINTGINRDKFPEKNSIRNAFTEIASKAQPNDILLVFFAGHGVMESEKNQFYFLTADASNNTVFGALKDVGISMDELTDWIKPQVMKAQKRILIFDACNSGQAITEMISIGKKDLKARGEDKGQQTKAIEKLNERSGMFILSASASDQKAYEMGRYNQGALTYSLLKAIKEEPGILEDRKYLNINSWFNAAQNSVNELVKETGARQQPQLVSTTNFNIGVVDEEVRKNILLPFEKTMFTRSDFRNTDLRIDNLKLRPLVDKQLDEISGDLSGTSIMYSPEYDGVNVYAISGDYTIKGNEVSVSVILTKGGTEIKTRVETKGVITDLEGLSKRITVSVLDWLKNNK